jgi:hypothetical protein
MCPHTTIYMCVCSGERLKETQAINKSLSALSDVFVAISKHQSHVPYRNSKLTFLLQVLSLLALLVQKYKN